MISKNNIKLIKSLKVKKYRLREKRFIVEGAKNVLELITSDYNIDLILCTDEFMQTHSKFFSDFSVVIVDRKLLEELGTFESNDTCLAVAHSKEYDATDIDFDSPIFVLDGINDPGNLGTIIRTLDWFGFNQIMCSKDSAELYNPKVVNSTMGSFTRVRVFYMDLSEFLKTYDKPIYGAEMNGSSLYETTIESPSAIVMGSESHGISEPVKGLLSNSITIPRVGAAESLNIAIATGIIANHLRVS